MTGGRRPRDAQRTLASSHAGAGVKGPRVRRSARGRDEMSLPSRAAPPPHVRSVADDLYPMRSRAPSSTRRRPRQLPIQTGTTFSPRSGTYGSAVTVTLRDATERAAAPRDAPPLAATTTCRETTLEKTKDGLSRKSVNNHLAALGKVLHLAEEWGVIDHGPKVKLSGSSRSAVRLLAFEERLASTRPCGPSGRPSRWWRWRPDSGFTSTSSCVGWRWVRDL
jgi:hypothetical protein